MNSDCYSIEHIGDLIDLDPDDPRLSHAAKCARCRNLLVSMREFRDPELLPADCNVRQAEESMERFIASELCSVDPSPPTPEAGIFHSLMQWFQPILRPVAGAACVILIALIVNGIQDREPTPGNYVVRNSRSGEEPRLFINSPARQTDGALLLSWTNLPASELYQVVFLSTSLTEIARFDAGADTSLLISSANLADSGIVGQQILWQVQARIVDGEVIRSQPVGIRF